MHTPVRAENHPAASRFLWFPAGAAAFFTCAFLYVLFRIEPAISLHGQGPAFFYGDAFRSSFLVRPGGLVEYASAFLGRCDAVPLLGSTIQAALALVLVVLTRGIAKTASGRGPGAGPFVAGFLWLLLRQTWGYQVYSLSLAFALALGLAWALSLAQKRSPWLRLALCWLFAVLLFPVAGPIAVIGFASVASLLEGVARRNWLCGIACLVPVSIPFAWVVANAQTSYWGAWIPGTTLARGLAAALLAWPILMSLFLRSVAGPATEVAPDTRSSGKKSKPTPRHWQLSLGTATAFIVFSGGLIALWLLFDQPRQARLQIDFYSARGDHERVMAIAAASKPGQLDLASLMRLQRSLYHAGRLGSDLFAYPSEDELELLPGLSGGMQSCRPQAETLYEMGLVNDAEHFAHEALEFEGERPDLLRLLGKINCLKDRPLAAKVFLSRLAQIPFEAEWTSDCLSNLEAKGTLPETIGLAKIRQCMLKRDVAHETFLAEPLLQLLLAANSTNRMAYDYLMTYYLLRRDFNKIAELLPRLEEFGCSEIPAHYEEALCIYRAMTNQEVKFQKLKLRDATWKRFEQFTRIVEQETRLKRNPLPALTADFGKTYWYYCAAHQTNAK